MTVAGIALTILLALPWVFVAFRAAGMPGWTYGAEPMIGWLRMWALVPVWLMLLAIIALGFAVAQSND